MQPPHPDEVVLVFLDEMGYYRWPAEGRTWGPVAPAPAPVADRDGPNNKRWRVIGALNALSGRVGLSGWLRRWAQEKVIRFYRQLVAAYPDVRRLYVVQDNWSIHRHEDVTRALVALPQIEPVLAADVCTLAESDREVVALAARACADDASPGGRLGSVARAGQRLSGSICG